MEPKPTAALLLIGSELLSGKVRDANAQPLAQLLFRHGIALQRIVAVPDDMETIGTETLRLAQTHTWVFTSGGVGPTHDDITVAAIARAFGQSVEVHPELAAMIQARYQDRCTEAHLRMAQVPQGTILETTEPHTREWPAMRLGNVWIFPGVPEAFRMKLGILSAALRRAGHVSGFSSVAVCTTLEESAIVDVLDRLVAELPTISIGSYPKWFDTTYRTKVTFDGSDAATLERAAAMLIERLPSGAAWKLSETPA